MMSYDNRMRLGALGNDTKIWTAGDSDRLVFALPLTVTRNFFIGFSSASVALPPPMVRKTTNWLSEKEVKPMVRLLLTGEAIQCKQRIAREFSSTSRKLSHAKLSFLGVFSFPRPS